jgi:hypothetical protein
MSNESRKSKFVGEPVTRAAVMADLGDPSTWDAEEAQLMAQFYAKPAPRSLARDRPKVVSLIPKRIEALAAAARGSKLRRKAVAMAAVAAAPARKKAKRAASAGTAKRAAAKKARKAGKKKGKRAR